MKIFILMETIKALYQRAYDSDCRPPSPGRGKAAV
jgi:hypothetical protein